MRPTFEPIDPTWRTSLLVLLCMVMGVVGIADCASMRAADVTEQAIRGGLNMTAIVVDPAYALAVQGCEDQESTALAVAVDGGDINAARSQLASIRARCTKIVAAFDEIREWHADAWQALEDGKIGQAQEQLDKIGEAWRTLTERISGP